MVVQFRDGKLASEHIYWDQASVLVQIGKLDPAGLPIAGVEVARKVRTEACQATSSWRGSGVAARANQSDIPFRSGGKASRMFYGRRWRRIQLALAARDPAFRGSPAVANAGWTSTPVVCFAQSAVIAQESLGWG